MVAATDRAKPVTRLLDIVHRPTPTPWAEGDKIPWDDPDFSTRMLREHLSQEHDGASRRFEIVDQHVGWIHESVLDARRTRILDLACGPGLYAQRLARLGHTCTGIDFAPASIAYARQQAEAEGLAIAYHQADIRAAEYGSDYGLVMCIYGEFNVFRPADAEAILQKAHAALAPGGWLLLEPHTFAAVKLLGEGVPIWETYESGLFGDRPHLLLSERTWDAASAVAITRYYVVDAATGAVTLHASSTQAYTDEEYHALLRRCGFTDISFSPSLRGDVDASQPFLCAIVARKSAEPGAAQTS